MTLLSLYTRKERLKKLQALDEQRKELDKQIRDLGGAVPGSMTSDQLRRFQELDTEYKTYGRDKFLALNSLTVLGEYEMLKKMKKNGVN